MSKCTWRDCELDAVKSQEANDGEVWAKLCQKHDKLLQAVLQDDDAKMLVATWIKAQGLLEF